MEWSIQRKLDKKAASAEKRKKWNKHFAFFPVVIGNKMHWLETVYRKENAFQGNWRYGTLMDILKEEEVQVNLNFLKGQAMTFTPTPSVGHVTSKVSDDIEI